MPTTTGSSNHPTTHLRKRQIVIVGHGTSVVAFCEKFKSDWAEVKVVSTVTDYAPQVVRNAVAAGHLLSKDVARLLRVRFSKRKNLDFISARVTGIDSENRVLTLDGEKDSLSYDYLLIGNSDPSPKDTEDAACINTVTDAVHFQSSTLAQYSHPKILIDGADPKAIDLASSLTKPPLMRLGKNAPSKVTLRVKNGFEFCNRKVDAKLEDRFATGLRWESISMLETSTAEQAHEEWIPLEAHRAELPEWIRSKVTDGDEAISSWKSKVGPDLRLRHDSRIFLLPELIQVLDSVGKTVPAEDSAWMQQGQHLAKVLRGIIEVRKGYDVDAPGFVLKDYLSFATIRKWKSIGFVGGRPFPPFIAFFLDIAYTKYPLFKLAYGSNEGFVKMVHWLRNAK